MATEHSKRYGRHHRELRARWKLKVDRGLVNCYRCEKPIAPGSRWDLGHLDGTNLHSGPEHSRCNRQTLTHAKEATFTPTKLEWDTPPRASREW